MNTVTVEGIIRHMWEYGQDRFLRLSVRREPELLPKRVDLDRQGRVIERRCDYITVRLPDGLAGVPVQKGQLIRVSGYLQSRDYPASLADFMRKANGPDLRLPKEYDPTQLVEGRSTTEVVAEEIGFASFQARRATKLRRVRHPAPTEQEHLSIAAQPVQFVTTETAA